MMPFPEQVLARIVENFQNLLHPKLFERTFLEVGAAFGRDVVTQVSVPRTPPSSTDQTNYVRCSHWMNTHWGWDHTVSAGKNGQFDVQCHRCPFEHLSQHNSHICGVEIGILGGIAGELFGYGKVVLQRGDGQPPRNCRFTIYTERMPYNIAAEGVTFPLTPQWPNSRTDADASRVLTRLTPRERQTLAQLAEGLSDKQIAEALRLSVRTVEGHLARIRKKTALHSRSALIRFALRSSTR